MRRPHLGIEGTGPCGQHGQRPGPCPPQLWPAQFHSSCAPAVVDAGWACADPKRGSVALRAGSQASVPGQQPPTLVCQA